MSSTIDASQGVVPSETLKSRGDDANKPSNPSNTSTTHSDHNGEEVIGSDNSNGGLVKKSHANFTFDETFSDDYLFEILIDYFTLDQIYKWVYPLSKVYRQKVEEANYLLLGKLADKLNITSTYLTSDLPCSRRVVDVYKRALISIQEEKPVDLKPNAFSTDSGLIGTNMWYGMHNIFDNQTSQYSYYVFSSNKGENNHIQAYLCNPGSYDNNFYSKMKSEFEEEPGSKNIYVPYDKLPLDGSTPTFKIPKVFEMNCRNQGYWYYTDNLALFFSESEVEHEKFNKSTKYFNNFKSVSEVKENSNLPILNIDDSEKGFTIIEFDLSKKNEMLKTMGISKFTSVPLIYINLDKNVAYGKNLRYEFKQNVAAKYMSMKLICWASYPSQSQLDMFPCTLKGISLEF